MCTNAVAVMIMHIVKMFLELIFVPALRVSLVMAKSVEVKQCTNIKHTRSILRKMSFSAICNNNSLTKPKEICMVGYF